MREYAASIPTAIIAHVERSGTEATSSPLGLFSPVMMLPLIAAPVVRRIRQPRSQCPRINNRYRLSLSICLSKNPAWIVFVPLK